MDNIYDILILTLLICIFCLLLILIINNMIIKKNINLNDVNLSIESTNELLDPPRIKSSLPDISIDEPILPDRWINLRTRGNPMEYQQLGILTSVNNPNDVRPLFGRQTYSGSNMWNYYSASNSSYGARIPIFCKGKICTDQNGCKEINDGEYIKIGNVNTEYFIFTRYSNNDYDYIPYIY